MVITRRYPSFNAMMMMMVKFLSLIMMMMNFCSYNHQVLAFQMVKNQCGNTSSSRCHIKHYHHSKQNDSDKNDIKNHHHHHQHEQRIVPLFDHENSSRRQFFHQAGLVMSTTGASASLFGLPENVNANIDVSGLQVEGTTTTGGGVSRKITNHDLADQLKIYDGSGSSRVREIQSMSGSSSSSQTTTTTTTTTTKSTASSTTSSSTSSSSSSSSSNIEDRTPIATWAYRANPGIGPTLKRSGPLGNLYRCTDQVVLSPTGSTTKRRAVTVQFEFPSDWLQLDRQSGGIQYVDQRNGDKLYIFRAPLPSIIPTTKDNDDGSNNNKSADDMYTLANIPKSIIGDMIFDPNGSLVRSGQTIEEYKVTNGKILTECPNIDMCSTRRRFKVKYVTVTGNGLRVDRRALVDVYQVGRDDMYMLMTSSNAIKFDQKDSIQRETVEKIVDSFQVGI